MVLLWCAIATLALLPLIGGLARFAPSVPVEWLLAIAAGVATVVVLVAGLRQRADSRAPCRHGTVGAKRGGSRCAECHLEVLQATASRVAADAAEMKKLREADEREAAAAVLALQLRRAEHLRSIRLPDHLRKMAPRDFERVVAELYRGMGYQATIGRYVSDGGVDIEARRSGELVLVQCKRVHGRVGAPIVRDLYGCVIHARATRGVLVTTGRVSRAARLWAKTKPIDFIEIAQLVELIRRYCPEAASALSK